MGLLPRSFRFAAEQIRRDVSMLARRASGKHSPPFTRRQPNSPALAVRRATEDALLSARRAEVLAPRTLRVARVVRETPDAITLVLEDPSGAPIHFAAGQFFTLLVRVAPQAELLRRAYSASSDAHDAARVAVTVKRVAGGAVSNHLNDHASEGELLQVLGPSGSFVVPDEPRAPAPLVLVAGGSGITPMMSIARTALAADRGVRITLVYGNRGERDVIFRAELDALARAYTPRFVVRHVLSDPPPGWSGGVGLLDARALGAELDACDELPAGALFFLCGPDPMMQAARDGLRSRGVADGRIVEERFNMPHLRAKPGAGSAAPAAGPQVLTIRSNGSGAREVYVGPDQTILEAGLSAGVAMDFSCAMGGCGACKVRLCDGEVEMEEPTCLTAQERADGYVLACVSRLRTAGTIATARDPAFERPVPANATARLGGEEAAQ